MRQLLSSLNAPYGRTDSSIKHWYLWLKLVKDSTVVGSSGRLHNVRYLMSTENIGWKSWWTYLRTIRNDTLTMQPVEIPTTIAADRRHPLHLQLTPRSAYDYCPSRIIYRKTYYMMSIGTCKDSSGDEEGEAFHRLCCRAISKTSPVPRINAIK